ncbi:MAG: glycosyltransferase family 4 protein [Candidatus Thorarchaeota archaeon]
MTDAFYPLKGGISHHLVSLCKSFQGKSDELYVFNPYYKGNRIFDNLMVSIKELNLNTQLLKYLLISFYKVLKDKALKFNEKLKIIFHLIHNPRNLLIVINNLATILPTLRTLNVDILVGGFPSNTLPLVFLLSRILNKKVVVFVYGNDFLIKNNILDRAFHFKTPYFKQADKIVVLGKTTKYFFHKIHKIDEKDIEIFPLAIFPEDYRVEKSKEELRKKYNIDNESFVLLSVGWHVPRKKFDLVIKAVKTIKVERPDIRIKYLSVGEGISSNYLKELASSLNLKNEVEFFGECANNVRNELYKLSDLFVMPSITTNDSLEGFGLVFLEANYHKVPVIGAYAGGVRDAVSNNETGLLVKPDDLGDLIDKILFFIDNKNKRVELGELGYQRVINKFLWTTRHQDFIEILRRLV